MTLPVAFGQGSQEEGDEVIELKCNSIDIQTFGQFGCKSGTTSGTVLGTCLIMNKMSI